MKEIATFIQDILQEGQYLIEAPAEYDMKQVSKKWKPNTNEIIMQWKNVLENIDSFDSAPIESEFKNFLEKNELGFGAVLLPFRILVTGVSAGPGMFDIAAFLGKEEVIKRIETGLSTISKLQHEA